MNQLMAASITCHPEMKPSKGNKTQAADFATIIMLYPDHDELVEVDLNSNENTNENYKPSQQETRHDHCGPHRFRSNMRGVNAHLQARPH